jgi:hypothetical protein
MPTQLKDGHQSAVRDTTTERAQDLMIELVRHGQDISLRSLQVWADLSRQLGTPALRSPARKVMVGLAYDLFEKLLTAQREVVDELVATQRQLAQQSVARGLGPPTVRVTVTSVLPSAGSTTMV